MKTEVRIAQPIAEERIPALEIVGTEAFPRATRETYRELEGLFDKEAKTIAAALRASLPGGTWDRLVAEMVRMHATLFVVRR